MNKSLLRLSVVFALVLCFAMSSLVSQTQAAAATFKVNTDTINVRSKPGTQYSTIGKLKRDQIVSVLEQKNNWSKITYGKGYGWVYSQYLKPNTWTGYVNGTSLNLRKTTSTKSTSLAYLAKGTSLTVEGIQGSWLKVYVPSKKLRGWVSSKYVSKKAEPVKTTPVPNNSLGTYYNIASSLNVRFAPTLSGKVLFTITKNTTVQLLEKNGTWGKIKSSNGTGWASLTYLSKNKVTVPVSTPLNSFVKGKVIVLDAGHGGQDPGTSGKENFEKSLSLKTTEAVSTLLSQAGAKVILTRESDTYLTLEQRVAISEKYNAHAFISIHYNAAESTSSGIMSFYYKSSKDLQLAKSIQEGMIGSTNMKDLGVRYGNFHVIRENDQAATLLELGFLSNPSEEKRISSATFQSQVSQGIFTGINEYFKNNR